MTYRQRNIPVPTKEENETQTDVRLLENYLLDARNQEEQWRTSQTTIKLSEVYASSGLLRPFGDNHLLKQFSRGLQQLKDLPFDDKIYGKRLQILESQIGGLLKRDFLVHGSTEGSQTWSSYYSTLNQKEKDVIRLQREKIYSDLKVVHLEERIKALELEVQQLRVSLVSSQQAVEENKIYSEFYNKIKTIIDTSERKGGDIEAAFQDQMFPAFTEFNFNLNALTRVINKEVSINIRSLTLNFAKELDRVLKQPNFNEDRLEENVLGFINNFRAVRGVEYLKTQFDQSQRTEIAENNYRNILSLFNHEIEELKSNHPNLKGAEKLDWLLRKLEDEKVDLVAINGWMNLATSELRVRQIKTEDKKLRELLGSLAGEFKRVYAKFPELQKHCPSSFIQILESEVLLELIEGGSIERLKEIIVHEVETVRVDSVYKYENTKDAKLIFHLRVLIKSLLEELFKVKEKYGIELALDQAILGLMKEQCLEGINVEEVIGLFRSPARYIQVPIVIENKVYESNTYEKGIPINTSNPIVITQEKLQVVTVNKEVAVYIENPVDHVIESQVPIQIITEKLVEAAVTKQVIVDRVVEWIKEIPTIREKIVPVYEREEIVKEIQIDRIIKDVEIREMEKIVQVKIQQILQIQKIVEKAVIANEYKEVIKEVEVRVPQIITKTELIEIEKKIPYIIEKEIPVEVRCEIPVEIKVPEIHFIDVIEYRDKPVVKTHTIEKLVPVELKVEKEIIREVPKQIFIDRSHFIKGDKEEVIRQVQVFIDKPIIHEVFRTKDMQVQKIVPLYITEQVPVIERIPEPYFSEKIKEISVQNVKIVTAKQEVVKPIEIDKPVPIIIEREIIKIQPQFIDRIVQKIVEVPRIVEIQRIVEKIVVVPRIIERIVEVPKIIEKIVICKEIELQIVEVPVPHIIIQEVEVPIEVIVEKIVIVRQKQIEKVDVPTIVERKTIEEKLVEVQVERQVPVEVIREVPVETYRDRIEYQRVQIHETKVETIEVQVPIIVQEKVPFIVQKEVIIHEIIQEPIYEKLIYEKEKPIITQVQKLIVKEVLVEKPIIVREVVEVPGPETIVRMVEQVQVEVIREKLVKQNQYVEIIKEVILEQDKIVPLIHERIVSVPVNEIITTPQLIQVPKIVNLVHYKEIPIEVAVREERIESRIVQDILEVEKKIEVPFQVQISREKIKEVIRQVKSIVNQETIKQIRQEVEILIPTETKIVQVPGQTIIQELKSEIRTVEVQDKAYEKLIEKIVMLPQIVEIIKNVHHISEVNQLGVAVDVDVNVHTEKFIGVSTELKKSLVQLLGTFRSNVGRQPDLKNLIVIIEKYLKSIDDWIAFPKLVEIEKEVIKEVEKERLVLVPTRDNEKESTLSYILERLLNELKRIKESHKISLNIEEDIQKIFFSERRGDEDLDKKFEEMQEELKAKYSNFGSWSESHPFLVNSFLQDHLSLKSLIEDANRSQRAQSEEISHLRHQLETSSSKYNHILCFNRKMFDDNNSLIKILEKYRGSIEGEEYQSNVRNHREFYGELITGKLPVFLSSIQRFSKFVDSEAINQQSEESSVTTQKEVYISELVSKLNKYEAENQSIMKRSRALESEMTKYSDELSVKNSIIRRLETDFESKLSRAKEELAKSPDLSRDILDENRRLLEKSRVWQKQVSSEKANFDKAKREFERSLESQKRDMNRELQRKEREIKEASEKAKNEYERELRIVSTELQKLKRAKDRLEDDLIEIKRRHAQEIKNIREQQMGGATDKHNQLINENLELRKKNDQSEAEFQKLKKAAIDNNTINERETQKLKTEIERLQIEIKSCEKKHKEGFLDLPQQTQIINKNIELEKKLKAMEVDLSKFREKDSSSSSEMKTLKDKVKNLEVELEIAKKEVEATQKMKSTTYQSGYKSGIGSELAVETSLVRSPGGAIFKSAEERGYVSPQSVQSEERIEELGSSSSRFSQESGEERTLYKPQMTLREFMDIKHGEDKDKDVYTTYVMIKIIEAIEKQAENGVYHSYAPNNIYLNNFNVKKLDTLTVKFGAQIINKNNKSDGLYLSPEVLGGSVSTKKSVVFCLGVILDELIHGEPFFRSMEEIQNAHIQFKVRGEKLNPILKNTLFEMMNKEPGKRLELIQAKRRLSLQKYITSEGRSSVTHQRISRRREE